MMAAPRAGGPGVFLATPVANAKCRGLYGAILQIAIRPVTGLFGNSLF